MPDTSKRPGTGRGMWPGRDVAAYAKSVFSMQFSVTFAFLFSQHSRLLSSKKRELATHFSCLCMSTTVSGSNSLSFAIIRDQSLEVWQRALRMTGDTDTAKSSKLFFPSSFGLLIFLKKAFSERKIALEIFPKKDEGTLGLHITVQSMTNATSETVGQVRKAIFACLTTDEKKMPLPLLSCTSLLSSSSSYDEGFLSLLEKIPKGDLAILLDVS